MPFDCNVSPRFVNEVFVLVEPDRDRRAVTEYQPVRDAALTLRQWSPARVVDAVQSLPVPREVSVEVHTTGIASRSGRCAVRVEVRQEPQIGGRLQRGVPEPRDDRLTGTFVAMNAPDDQDTPRRPRIS